MELGALAVGLDMRLLELAKTHVLRNDLSDAYLRQLICTVNSLAALIGFAPSTSDLTIENINRVVANPKISKTTRDNRRRMLMTLAGVAAQERLIDRIDPFYIHKVKKQKQLPKGYSWDEANRIVFTLENPPVEWAPGQSMKQGPAEWLNEPLRNGLIRRQWWLAFVLMAWDTGHPSDITRFTKSEMDMNGRITAARSKTGKLIRSQLSAAALRAVHAIQLERDRKLLPRWCHCVNKKCLSEDFGKISHLAGVGGFIKYLRAGAGSNVENENPGTGHLFLSNNRRTFEEHYWDRRHDSGPILSPRPLRVG